MIHMTISPTISAKSYRQAMIANYFVCRILLSSSPSGSIGDLTAIVAASFVLSSNSAEREAKRIVD